MKKKEPPEITVLMPCLNEAETINSCISKAKNFLKTNNIRGEILVADNGSFDGSQEIARAGGAKVIPIPQLGYGAALWGGIKSARGRYVIMGDADDSYDFSALMPFVLALRAGADLVVGDRFAGGIELGAMPPLHRYLGNPLLSWIGRLFFRIKISDFQCGLRGFSRERMLSLKLKTTGMEFASEMIVRAALANHRIEEVPTKLSKDGRKRAPHLRTWSDGWRYLTFLLIYSPKWLFLYPGLFLTLVGFLTALVLFRGTAYVGGIGFDVHTFIVGCICLLIGSQAVSFAVIARRYAQKAGLLPHSVRYTPAFNFFTLNRLMLLSLWFIFPGLIGFSWCVISWVATGFGDIEYAKMLRLLLLSLTSIALGAQLIFTGFLSEILSIDLSDIKTNLPK